MKKFIFIPLILLSIYTQAFASISVDSFVTPDDVTIDHLEEFRETVVDAINSFDGGLIQNDSITASKLDDNANPEVRWNEAFNDFVYTGLTVPTTSGTLTSTTAAGTAYINGTRVVKVATSKTYTASKYTFVDLSSTGVFTYQETAIGASDPAVSTNSIRLARVSTDSTSVLSVRDDRVTEINIAAGSAGSIADTDADTGIKTEQSADEDILRFTLGNTTLSSAREVLTLQAQGTNNEKLEPTTTNEVDLGSTSKKYRYLYATNVSADNTVYLAETTSPTTGSGSGAVYTKSSSSKTEFFFRGKNNETELQITKGGYINAANVSIFTSSGTFTAPTGITKVYINECGGGGGGGANSGAGSGAGGGGGGAGIIHQAYTVVAGNNYTVTIGAGGLAGSGTGAGGNGGTTSFDTLSVLGGTGGSGGSAGAGGAGGVGGLAAVAGAGGTSAFSGGAGAAGSAAATPGGGGGSVCGVGATENIGGGDPGVSASANSGGGATGSGGSNATGGTGGSGIVIVQW